MNKLRIIESAPKEGNITRIKIEEAVKKMSDEIQISYETLCKSVESLRMNVNMLGARYEDMDRKLMHLVTLFHEATPFFTEAGKVLRRDLDRRNEFRDLLYPMQKQINRIINEIFILKKSIVVKDEIDSKNEE